MTEGGPEADIGSPVPGLVRSRDTPPVPPHRSRGTTHTVRGRRHRHRHAARDSGAAIAGEGGQRSTGGVAAVALAPRWPRPTAVRAGGGAVAVVVLVVHVSAGPHGGAGAPAEFARRTCALGRHSWLPHIAVPSPPQILLPCAAHQSECGRTAAYPRPATQEGPSP